MPEETDQLIDAESKRLRQQVGPGGGFGVLSSFDPTTGQTQTTSVAHPTPVQNFDDPAYRQKLFEWEQETRRTAEAARAEQAIQAGIRFIYQRRYDDDLKKGVPEQQAFSRMMLGIAMHGPKTDPIKAYEAFRARPAPTARMMQVGTNQVPVIETYDAKGNARVQVVPQNALPPSSSGPEIKEVDGIKFRRVGNGWAPLPGQSLTRKSTPVEQAQTKAATTQWNTAAELLTVEQAKAQPNQKKIASYNQTITNASNTLAGISREAPKAQPAAASEQPAAKEPTVTTKSDYDKLESGTIYIGKDGRRYRKP